MKLNNKMRFAAVIILIAVIAIVTILTTGCSCTDNPNPMPTVDALVTPTAVITEVPTEAPTEVPTEEPTEEPTVAPTEVPEGWYIDPTGIIPPTVEILVHDEVQQGNKTWCITRNNGKVVLQMWMKSGLQKEWEVPEDMLRGVSLSCVDNCYQMGDVSAGAWITEPYNGPSIWFYQDSNGNTLFFECNLDGIYANSEFVLIGTTDGKAIWYCWGDNFYRMHDFGSGTIITAESGFFFINGWQTSPREITYMNINI